MCFMGRLELKASLQASSSVSLPIINNNKDMNNDTIYFQECSKKENTIEDH